MPTISKGRFAAGLQCVKRLHLEVHAPELREPEDAGMAALAAAGTALGVLARGRFPGGVLVAPAAAGWEDRVAATAALVADPGVATLFEAAFEHDGVRVRADVLQRTGPAAFALVEVKSGGRVREHHEIDLAFQVAVLRRAGIAVERAELLLVDRDYVHPGGPADPARLFRAVDLTEKVRTLASFVEARLAAMQAVLAGPTPAVPVGVQCLVPRRCPFFGHCHAGGPAEPVTALPRLTPDQLAALAAAGIADPRDVPPDFPGLSPLQRRACAAVRAGRAIREPGVVARLAAIPRPAHFVDFETFAPAVPVYPGTRPFEQVPFQWSDHVLAADGGVRHHEFLYDADDDPRRAFAESLLAATADAAALVVYSSFEGEVLAALARELPDLASALLERRARIVDLLPIVRDHCYHPALRGSFSIKRVLPAFVPGLGYDDLAIRDGLTASLAHAELVDPAVPPARRAVLRAALLAYCRRDTEAMLALHRTLAAPLGAAESAAGPA